VLFSVVDHRSLLALRSLLYSSASGILLSASVAQASPVLLLILLNAVVEEHVMEISNSEDITKESRIANESKSCSRLCKELALSCLSFLLLHIPESCNLISESLLCSSSIIFTRGIEFCLDQFTITASTVAADEPVSLSLFNIERQSAIQSFCDALGDTHKGLKVFRALECVKQATVASAEPVQIAVQLIASLINFMLKSARKMGSEPSFNSISVLLCLEVLLDDNSDLAPSNTFILVAPVASWLDTLARSQVIDWLAIGAACSLWSAAAASVSLISNTSENSANDFSVGASLELASLALRRVVSLQPPENVASEVVVACDSCAAAFRAISSAALVANSTSCAIGDMAADLISQCSEPLPSHIRCGALLQLQSIILENWHGLQPSLKEAVLNAVQACLFDAAAAVYVAAVEVLCCIGRVDPSSAFSFGAKFLANNSTDGRSENNNHSNIAGKDKSKHDAVMSSAVSRDLALCKVLDALGDTVLFTMHFPASSNSRAHAQQLTLRSFRFRPLHQF
jgi:hypothetical protein